MALTSTWASPCHGEDLAMVRMSRRQAGMKQTGTKQTGMKQTGMKRTDMKRTDMKRTDMKPTDMKQAGTKHAGMERTGSLLRQVGVFVVSLALAACAVGPDFKPPVNQPAALVNAHSSDRAPLLAQTPDGLWWQQFDDAVLNQLIARALESNLDLQMAVDRVRAARAAFSGANTICEFSSIRRSNVRRSRSGSAIPRWQRLTWMQSTSCRTCDVRIPAMVLRRS